MRILQVQWIALSVLCSLLLLFWVSFVKFYNSVNSSVQYLTECRLVHSLVFSPLSVLAYKECPQYVGEVKSPSLQWYRTFEIGDCIPMNEASFSDIAYSAAAFAPGQNNLFIPKHKSKSSKTNGLYDRLSRMNKELDDIL